MKATLLSLLLLLPLAAAAQNVTVETTHTDGNRYRFSLADGEATLTDAVVTDYLATLDIPSAVEHDGETYPVTAIDDYALVSYDSLGAVVIPASVRTIGEMAFYYCTNLAEVTIGGGVETIGDLAFGDCGIRRVRYNAPAALYSSSTGYGCFEDADYLTTLILGPDVETLPALMFDNLYMLDSLLVEADRLIPITSQDLWNSGDGSLNIVVRCSQREAYQGHSVWASLGTVTASCEDEGFASLTVVSADASMGTALGSRQGVVPGTQLTAWAAPLAGHAFLGWDDAVLDNPRQLTLDSSLTLTALFAPADLADTLRLYADTLHVVDTLYADTLHIVVDRYSDTLHVVDSVALGAPAAKDAAFSFTTADGVVLQCEVLGSAYGNAVQINGATLGGVTDLVIPDQVSDGTATYTVGYLAYGAFYGEPLTSLVLPASMREVNYQAFRDCTSLTYVDLGGTDTVWEDAFGGCTALQHLRTNAPQPVLFNFSGMGAFDECDALATVTFGPDVVDPATGDLFTGLPALATVNIEAERLLTASSWLFHGSNRGTLTVNVPCSQLALYQADAQWASIGTLAAPCSDQAFSVSVLAQGPDDCTAWGDTTAVAEGHTATLLATPWGGRAFLGWSDGNGDNPRTLVVTSDTTLTALFATAEPHTDTLLLGTLTLRDTLTLGTLTLYDTVDRGTLVVHDTVYYTLAVVRPEAAEPRVALSGRTLVVQGADGQPLELFDMAGRRLALLPAAPQRATLALPAAGAYLLRMAGSATRKIVAR